VVLRWRKERSCWLRKREQHFDWVSAKDSSY
jgi:hypothetical protein